MIVLLAGAMMAQAGDKKQKAEKRSPLDEYLAGVAAQEQAAATASAGAIWSTSPRFIDLAADLRARRTDDIVTIVVFERASALARGTSRAARASSAKATIPALAGISNATGALTNLADVSTDTSLDGQAETSRETLLRTTLTGRVTQVLPNGNLVVQASKNVTVNSESQVVTVRGIVRPIDLSTANAVASDQIAEMEVTVNGKGLVGDAVRRPNFIYRLLLGILPF